MRRSETEGSVMLAQRSSSRREKGQGRRRPGAAGRVGPLTRRRGKYTRSADAYSILKDPPAKAAPHEFKVIFSLLFVNIVMNWDNLIWVRKVFREARTLKYFNFPQALSLTFSHNFRFDSLHGIAGGSKR